MLIEWMCSSVSWFDPNRYDLAIKTAITIHTFYSALLLSLLVLSFYTFQLETYVIYISCEVNRHQKQAL